MLRNLSLDILKIILVLMVIGLHTQFLQDYHKWTNYLFVNGIFRIAVPTFFIINGYFFHKVIDRSPSRWFYKIFTLYAVWMTIYSYYWITRSLSGGSFGIIVMQLTKEIVVGYWHLWYLMGTFGAGIILFFLKKCKLKDSCLICIGVSTFFIGLLIQYIGNYHLISTFIIDQIFNYTFVYRNAIFFSFPFFLIGYLISKRNYYVKYTVSIFVASLILLLIECNINYFLLDDLEEFDILFSLIILCPSLFLLAIRSYYTTKIMWLSSMATAIYLVHPLFINIFWNLFNFSSMNLMLFVLFLSVISSCILIIINKKIKFIL